MSSIDSVICEDFCTHFRTNGDKIDYLLRYKADRSSANGLQTDIEVIVGGKHWTMTVTRGTPMTVELDRNKSAEAQHFTDHYFGAACLWKGTSGDGSCDILLFPKAKPLDSLDVLTVLGGENVAPEDLSGFGSLQRVPLTDLPNDTYKYVSHGDFSLQLSDPYIALFSQRSQELFPESFVFQRTENSIRAIRLTNITEKSVRETNVLAVHSFWGPKKDNYGVEWATDSTYGHLVLSKSDLIIYWHFGRHNDKLWKYEDILVNCTGTVPLGAIVENEEQLNILMIAVFLSLFIFLLAIAAAIGFWAAKVLSQRKTSMAHTCLKAEYQGSNSNVLRDFSDSAKSFVSSKDRNLNPNLFQDLHSIDLKH